MPFVLALQCLFFYLPLIAWRMVCARRTTGLLFILKKLKSNGSIVARDKRDATINEITECIDDQLSERLCRNNRVMNPSSIRTFDLWSSTHFAVCDAPDYVWPVSAPSYSKNRHSFPVDEQYNEPPSPTHTHPVHCPFLFCFSGKMLQILVGISVNVNLCSIYMNFFQMYNG